MKRKTRPHSDNTVLTRALSHLKHKSQGVCHWDVTASFRIMSELSRLSHTCRSALTDDAAVVLFFFCFSHPVYPAVALVCLCGFLVSPAALLLVHNVTDYKELD